MPGPCDTALTLSLVAQVLGTGSQVADSAPRSRSGRGARIPRPPGPRQTGECPHARAHHVGSFAPVGPASFFRVEALQREGGRPCVQMTNDPGHSSRPRKTTGPMEAVLRFLPPMWGPEWRQLSFPGRWAESMLLHPCCGSEARREGTHGGAGASRCSTHTPPQPSACSTAWSRLAAGCAAPPHSGVSCLRDQSGRNTLAGPPMSPGCHVLTRPVSAPQQSRRGSGEGRSRAAARPSSTVGPLPAGQVQLPRGPGPGWASCLRLAGGSHQTGEGPGPSDPLTASPPPQEAPAVTAVQELQQGHQRARQSLGHQQRRHHGRRQQVREGQHAVAARGAAEAAQGRGGRHRPQAGQDPGEGVARAARAGTLLFLSVG